MRASRRNTRKSKQDRLEDRVVDKKETIKDDYNLDWYKPKGRQQDIKEGIEDKDLVIVNAPSGVGKSSTIIHTALQEYKAGKFQKIILIKTPAEATDDALGFLSGNKEEKLSAHMASMRSIFLQFMSINKLENDIKNGNIVFDVPNYLLGATLNSSLIILEEAQTMSPNTIKLCAERAGKRSKVVVAGDSQQRYAVKKRQDGLADLIERTTYDIEGVRFPIKADSVAYIEIDSSHNMRSSLSRYITDIYND